MSTQIDTAAMGGVSKELIDKCPEPVGEVISGLTTELSQIHDRLEEVEETAEKKDERIEQLEETVDQQADRLEMQSGLIQNLADQVDDLEEDLVTQEWVTAEMGQEIDRLEKEIAIQASNIGGAHNRISDLKEDIEEGGIGGSNPGSEGGDDGSSLHDLLPIDRVVLSDDVEDCTIGNVTPSVERAAAIYENFRKWSDKTAAGRVIHTSGGKRGASLKTLLETATGESLEWKQVTRACRKIEEWSKGTIQFKQSDRHGWMLIGPDDIKVGYGQRQSSSPADQGGASPATA